MNTDYSIMLSLEQADMLLKATDGLPQPDKGSVVFQDLRKQLETIRTVLSRNEKNKGIKKKIANSQMHPQRRAKKR